MKLNLGTGKGYPMLQSKWGRYNNSETVEFVHNEQVTEGTELQVGYQSMIVTQIVEERPAKGQHDQPVLFYAVRINITNDVMPPKPEPKEKKTEKIKP